MGFDLLSFVLVETSPYMGESAVPPGTCCTHVHVEARESCRLLHGLGDT